MGYYRLATPNEFDNTDITIMKYTTRDDNPRRHAFTIPCIPLNGQPPRYSRARITDQHGVQHRLAVLTRQAGAIDALFYALAYAGKTQPEDQIIKCCMGDYDGRLSVYPIVDRLDVADPYDILFNIHIGAYPEELDDYDVHIVNGAGIEFDDGFYDDFTVDTLTEQRKVIFMSHYDDYQYHIFIPLTQKALVENQHIFYKVFSAVYSLYFGRNADILDRFNDEIPITQIAPMPAMPQPVTTVFYRFPDLEQKKPVGVMPDFTTTHLSIAMKSCILKLAERIHTESEKMPKIVTDFENARKEKLEAEIQKLSKNANIEQVVNGQGRVVITTKELKNKAGKDIGKFTISISTSGLYIIPISQDIKNMDIPKTYYNNKPAAIYAEPLIVASTQLIGEVEYEQLFKTTLTWLKGRAKGADHA